MEIIDKQNIFRITADDLFEQSPIPLAIVSLDCFFLKVNPAFQEYSGYASSELENKKTFKEITHPEDLVADLQMMQGTISGKIHSDTYEMVKRYITKTGQIVWGKLGAKLVKNDNDEPMFFIAHVTPIIVEPRLCPKPDYHKKSKIQEFLKENWKTALTLFFSAFLGMATWSYQQFMAWTEFKIKAKEYIEYMTEEQKKRAGQITAPPPSANNKTNP